MNWSLCFASRQVFSKRGGCAWHAGIIGVAALVAVVSLCQPSPAVAQSARNVSYPLLSANEPPGALGLKRRIAGGDIGDDFFQAVRMIVPDGALVGPADSPPDPSGPQQTVFGLHVGRPYRFVITRIPLLEDLPLYPSIELIDRTYPPEGMEARFAIPIEFTIEDLRQAANGNYVERVVYVEDPELALPIAMQRDAAQNVFDVADDEDPLAIAGSLGRPVALVRLGAKAPDPGGADAAFLFGGPPVQFIDPHPIAVGDDQSRFRPRSRPGKSASPVFQNPRLRRILR